MKDNSTAQLLPCPFCGSEMESSHGAFGHIGGQPTCPIYYTAFDDAEAGDWNTRAPVSQDAAQLVEHWKKECNRYVNGECHTRRCLVRGGWIEGPVDYSLASCEVHEAIEALTRVQPSTGLDWISGLRDDVPVPPEPCPTCGAKHPFDNVFCSNGFHSPETHQGDSTK